MFQAILNSLKVNLIFFNDVLKVVLLSVTFLKSFLKLPYLLLKQNGLASSFIMAVCMLELLYNFGQFIISSHSVS